MGVQAVNDFDSTVFSRRLKALREERGLSQAQLANASGIDKSAIARYETGRTLPGIDRAVTLARALDCSVDVLAGCVPLVGASR